MSLDPRLRLRHLTGFMEIARAGSLVAAADRMAVTQPAVSKTLRELEDILGKQLFDRSGRRLKLNAQGQLFQRLVGNALGELERADRVVRGNTSATTRLSVGALPTAATRLLPQAALVLRQDYPLCSLRASTGPNWLLLSQLRETELDLVVGRMADADQMRGLTFEQLFQEDIVAVIRPGHPQQGELTLNDLLHFPLILPPKGAVIGPVVSNYLFSVGAAGVSAFLNTVSLAIGREVVQQSDAVWFISRGVVAHEVDQGTLRIARMNQPMIVGPVGISLRENMTESAELQALIVALRLVAARLRPAAGY
jgi:LysR family pca operon transcriptional activator